MSSASFCPCPSPPATHSAVTVNLRLKSDPGTPLLRILPWVTVAPKGKARLPNTALKTLCDLSSPCSPTTAPFQALAYAVSIAQKLLSFPLYMDSPSAISMDSSSSRKPSFTSPNLGEEACPQGSPYPMLLPQSLYRAAARDEPLSSLDGELFRDMAVSDLCPHYLRQGTQ